MRMNIYSLTEHYVLTLRFTKVLRTWVKKESVCPKFNVEDCGTVQNIVTGTEIGISEIILKGTFLLADHNVSTI
jgi:hypothetical protein